MNSSSVTLPDRCSVWEPNGISPDVNLGDNLLKVGCVDLTRPLTKSGALHNAVVVGDFLLAAPYRGCHSKQTERFWNCFMLNALLSTTWV